MPWGSWGGTGRRCTLPLRQCAAWGGEMQGYWCCCRGQHTLDSTGTPSAPSVKHIEIEYDQQDKKSVKRGRKRERLYSTGTWPERPRTTQKTRREKIQQRKVALLSPRFMSLGRISHFGPYQTPGDKFPLCGANLSREGKRGQLRETDAMKEIVCYTISGPFL